MQAEGEAVTGAGARGRQIEAVATRRDRAAFVALFDHFAPRVKTLMLRSGESDATAEEIAQQTMLTVWRKADLFIPGSAGAAAWIFTIALRIDALRRERYNRSNSGIGKEARFELCVDKQTGPESRVAAEQLEQCVREAMGQLSNGQARVIELAFFEEKSQSEIAAQLQIPLGTVKSRLRLAIGRLRKLLGEP